MNLEGKNVLVTGANSGIGRVTAIELARLKASVILACRSEERARPVLDAIVASGGKGEYLHLDLADLASVRAAAGEFLKRDEPLSILVNNAGLAGAHGTTAPEYCVSKLANVLFSAELARRSPSSVHTYALHPGAVASDVWREVPWGLRHLMKLFMLSNEQGARTTLYCATSDEAGSQTGRYYDGCREKTPSALARDAELAGELWQRSADYVGLAA